MIKTIIYFNDIRLYNDCALQAQRIGLATAGDYIVHSLENYFAKKYPNKFTKKIGEIKDEKNLIPVFKKPIELWLACEAEVKLLGNCTIADFIEAVCRQAVYPDEKIAVETAVEPVKQHDKTSLMRQISEFMTLPKG